MGVQLAAESKSVREQVSAAEWEARVDLALLGWESRRKGGLDPDVMLAADILGADLRERASETRVVRDERAIQIEDIHDGTLFDVALIGCGRVSAAPHLHSTYRLAGWFTPFAQAIVKFGRPGRTRTCDNAVMSGAF